MVADRFGELEKAYYFDGVSSYIKISESILNADQESFTLTAWTTHEPQTTNGIVFYSGTDSRVGEFSLKIQESKNRVQFGINYSDPHPWSTSGLKR